MVNVGPDRRLAPVTAGRHLPGGRGDALSRRFGEGHQFEGNVRLPEEREPRFKDDCVRHSERGPHDAREARLQNTTTPVLGDGQGRVEAHAIGVRRTHQGDQGARDAREAHDARGAHGARGAHDARGAPDGPGAPHAMRTR